MHVLTIDTATAAVTAGIARIRSGTVELLAERVTVDARRHGEALAPGIADCMAAAGLAPADVAAVIAGVGPGPFTGLRVGLVTAAAFADALGLDAGDKRITYVGGDYPASWLCGEVDAGRAELAVLIAPVTVDDFVAVNLARLRMPRKSTWFTPKARTGLILVDLTDAGA